MQVRAGGAEAVCAPSFPVREGRYARGESPSRYARGGNVQPVRCVVRSARVRAYRCGRDACAGGALLECGGTSRQGTPGVVCSMK